MPLIRVGSGRQQRLTPHMTVTITGPLGYSARQSALPQWPAINYTNSFGFLTFLKISIYELTHPIIPRHNPSMPLKSSHDRLCAQYICSRFYPITTWQRYSDLASNWPYKQLLWVVVFLVFVIRFQVNVNRTVQKYRLVLSPYLLVS